MCHLEMLQSAQKSAVSCKPHAIGQSNVSINGTLRTKLAGPSLRTPPNLSFFPIEMRAMFYSFFFESSCRAILPWIAARFLLLSSYFIWFPADWLHLSGDWCVWSVLLHRVNTLARINRSRGRAVFICAHIKRFTSLWYAIFLVFTCSVSFYL